MMDSATQQLAHKIGVFLSAGMIGVAFLFMLAVAWQQGDGQAREMVVLLQPSVLSALGFLAIVLGVNTVSNAVVAIKTAQAQAQAAVMQSTPNASAVPSTAAAPAPVAVPVAPAPPAMPQTSSASPV